MTPEEANSLFGWFWIQLTLQAHEQETIPVWECDDLTADPFSNYLMRNFSIMSTDLAENRQISIREQQRRVFGHSSTVITTQRDGPRRYVPPNLAFAATNAETGPTLGWFSWGCMSTCHLNVRHCFKNQDFVRLLKYMSTYDIRGIALPSSLEDGGKGFQSPAKAGTGGLKGGKDEPCSPLSKWHSIVASRSRTPPGSPEVLKTNRLPKVQPPLRPRLLEYLTTKRDRIERGRDGQYLKRFHGGVPPS
ncbi:hypothetical protein SODALDRAFT_355491 [Sodiomyces alkalinus F11]|uniref:Uncharacterized protein n=1 Tax=Sodiomyces alkalinus (strain CBS 110278 / VKM F-3762 / F11) TaxID=1314773 RepID=A0A3N2Q945_SODAK|nr:hypothetical protein SODALDRAFT_355491 [Sodiomyces alkalinus F11]ROT43284.1 hypothetical protein SODALDRAFT_355491 [Sodiomyces alkalinus F11]